MYAYAGNNPVKYTDPDGREIFSFSLKDFLNYTNDPLNKLYNEMKLADSGDKNARENLNYIFHEAGRESLKHASSTMNGAAIVSLCIGLPEGTAVFGTMSTAFDFLLVADDFISGNKSKGVKDGVVLIAGVVFSAGAKQSTKAISKGINITIGKTGRYYEVGTVGAIKTGKALRKIILKDILSGYFGSEIIPNAKLIVDEAIKVSKKLKDVQ